ncbi:MAG: hypothetical protein ACXVQ6_13795 [Actinomycetota bacterium]
MPAQQLGVVVAHDDRAVIEEIAAVLESTPGLFVAGTSLAAARPGHVLVAGGEVLINARATTHPLVALASDDPVRAARAAIAAGARELLRWPEESERLPGAIRRAAGAGSQPHGDGRVVAVAGARGGVGASTVAALLAAALGRCIVADLDVVGAGQRAFAPAGAVVTFDQLPLADLSADALGGALVAHLGEAAALHARPFGEEPAVPHVNGLLRAARAKAAFTVVDCGRGASGATRAVADGAEIRVIVATDDVASIRGVRVLAEHGWGDALLVLRRLRPRAISRRDLIAAFGRRPAVTVRTDRRIARAVDLGRLPRRMPKTIASLARLIEAAR